MVVIHEPAKDKDDDADDDGDDGEGPGRQPSKRANGQTTARQETLTEVVIMRLNYMSMSPQGRSSCSYDILLTWGRGCLIVLCNVTGCDHKFLCHVCRNGRGHARALLCLCLATPNNKAKRGRDGDMCSAVGSLCRPVVSVKVYKRDSIWVYGKSWTAARCSAAQCGCMA
jgi:hypothetical protein